VKPGPRRTRHDVPIAITALGPSLDEQHEARKRKYLVMMGLRIVCVIAAVATYTTSLWIALGFMVGGAVLPWCAVLIANDRPPRHQTAFVRFHAPDAERQLEPGSSATRGAESHPSFADGRTVDMDEKPDRAAEPVAEWLHDHRDP
jgi:hypothetical protein